MTPPSYLKSLSPHVDSVSFTAIADELMDYANGKKWQSQLLEASHDLAKQTLLDAETFASAYDDGVFQR